MPVVSHEDVVAQIPTPDEIRSQLARNLRENRILRRLLSIAEQAHQHGSSYPTTEKSRGDKR